MLRESLKDFHSIKLSRNLIDLGAYVPNSYYLLGGSLFNFTERLSLNIKFLRENLDKTNTFIYLERYVNEGSRTYSTFAQHFDGHKKYHPVYGVRAFRVPCLRLPIEKVEIFLANPDIKLLNKYIQDSTILLPVHPEIFKDDSVPFIKELRSYFCTSILVAPAASTRTVMTMVQPHFIKLHYPRRVSRFIRAMTKDIIKTSTEVSKSLAQSSLPNFGFLPESIGVAIGDSPDSWGFIIRENLAKPEIDEKRFLIPLFALYSQDLNNKHDLPLLIQLIELHKQDPVNFTLEHIMKPIIKIWCNFIRKEGFLLEMHGENNLLELDEHCYPSRIIYRDLDVKIDIQTRQRLSLHTDFPKSRYMPYESEKTYSRSYDGSIGHHLFDYMCEILQQHYGINPKVFQKACKETFHEHFPDAHNYFSDTVYYYTEELSNNNKYVLTAIKDKPKWR